MPSILVATGFVRIDADTKPALKALQAMGSIGANFLTTAIGPAVTTVVTGIASVSAAAATAGAAVGVYGVAVKQQFTQIQEVMQKKTAAEDADTKATNAKTIAQRLAKDMGIKYGQSIKITKDMTEEARQKAETYNSALSAATSATKTAKMAQEGYKSAMADLPPETAKTAEALQNLKDTTKSWSDSLSSTTMPVFTKGIQFLTGLIPKLTPIVKSVAKEVDGFVSGLGEGSAGKIFREFGKNVNENGAGALRNFLEFGKNMTAGILGILNAFMPMSAQVTGGLQGMSEKFATWSAGLASNQGFKTFTQIAQDAGPRLAEVLKVVADAFVKVASAAGPLSGIGLKVIEILAGIIDAIPTPVLKLLVPAILAVNVAMKLYAIYTAAASAATWFFSTSVTVGAGATYASRAALLAAIAGFIWHRIVTLASAVATGIWTAATYAFAVAQLVVVGVIKGLILVIKGLGIALKFLFTNPIGLAILALVAIGVALYMAWKRSETFRNIVKGALDVVKNVAVAVGNWFAGPFVRFFTETIPNAFKTVLDWVRKNWPWLLGALAGPIGLAVVAIIKHWDSIKRGIAAAWEAIKRNVINPIKNFFTQTIPGWAKFLRDKVVEFFKGVLQGYINIYKMVKERVFDPLIRFFTVHIPNGARNFRDRVVGFLSGFRDRAVDIYRSVKSRFLDPLIRFFTVNVPNGAKNMKDKVVGFFTNLRDGVGKVVNGVKEKVKTPINWVLDHVWNNGIRSVWGKIAGWIGIKNTLGKIKLLAAGGTVGNEPMGIFNRPTAIVGEGRSAHPEYVIPTDPRYRGRARALWEQAGYQLMEDGGILGKIGGWLGDRASDVGGAIKGAADFFTDPLGAAKKLLKKAVPSMAHLGSSPWVKMITSLPGKAIDGLLNAVKKVGSSLLAGIGLGGSGGSGVKRWTQVVQMALRMLGQPAAYTALTLRRMNQESGGNPTIVNRWDSNWKAGHPSVGLMQVIRGTFQAYAGRYRNTGPFLYGVSTNPMANIYASMRYALAAYGSLPRAYNRAGGYRNGTTSSAAGMHLFGEAGPELGFTPAGWRILSARRSAGIGGGITIERLVLENHGVIGSQYETENWLVESLDSLRRKGRI